MKNVPSFMKEFAVAAIGQAAAKQPLAQGVRPVEGIGGAFPPYTATANPAEAFQRILQGRLGCQSPENVDDAVRGDARPIEDQGIIPTFSQTMAPESESSKSAGDMSKGRSRSIAPRSDRRFSKGKIPEGQFDIAPPPLIASFGSIVPLTGSFTAAAFATGGDARGPVRDRAVNPCIRTTAQAARAAVSIRDDSGDASPVAPSGTRPNTADVPPLQSGQHGVSGKTEVSLPPRRGRATRRAAVIMTGSAGNGEQASIGAEGSGTAVQPEGPYRLLRVSDDEPNTPAVSPGNPEMRQGRADTAGMVVFPGEGQMAEGGAEGTSPLSHRPFDNAAVVAEWGAGPGEKIAVVGTKQNEQARDAGITSEGRSAGRNGEALADGGNKRAPSRPAPPGPLVEPAALLQRSALPEDTRLRPKLSDARRAGITPGEGRAYAAATPLIPHTDRIGSAGDWEGRTGLQHRPRIHEGYAAREIASRANAGASGAGKSGESVLQDGQGDSTAALRIGRAPQDDGDNQAPAGGTPPPPAKHRETRTQGAAPREGVSSLPKMSADQGSAAIADYREAEHAVPSHHAQTKHHPSSGEAAGALPSVQIAVATGSVRPERLAHQSGRTNVAGGGSGKAEPGDDPIPVLRVGVKPDDGGGMAIPGISPSLPPKNLTEPEHPPVWVDNVAPLPDPLPTAVVDFMSFSRGAEIHRATSAAEHTLLMTQVIDAAQPLMHQGGGRVVISLNPPSLGALDIDVRVHRDRVELFVVASDRDVQQTLFSHVDQLRESLVEMGLNMDRFQVVVGERSDGQSGRDPGQEGMPGWQGEGPGDRGYHREAERESAGEAKKRTALNDAYPSDGYINLFI